MASQFVTSVYGRVKKVDGDKVTVSFSWTTKIREREIDAKDIRKLDGSLTFGTPIGYKDGKKWRAAKLIHMGKKQSWVAAFAGKPKQVPTDSIKAVDVKKYKKGDKVWASFAGTFKPATVTGVMEEGVKYQVKFDKWGDTEVSLAEITAPLE
jgi:hypothetical protein